MELLKNMRKTLRDFCCYYGFWILFFFLNRWVFVLAHPAVWKEASLLEILEVFYRALPMDLSTTAYILTIPVLIWSLFFLFRKNHVGYRWLYFYTIGVMVLYAFLTIVDFNIYREWSVKLNHRALSIFISDPHIAVASSMAAPLLQSFMVGGFLIFAGWAMYRMFRFSFLVSNYPVTVLRVALVLMLFALQVVVIRGGLSTSPLTVSSVYYSNHRFLNQAALNTGWNLLTDVIENKSDSQNPFRYMSTAESDRICDSLFSLQDSGTAVLTQQRPNIVLIVLESFTADLMEVLGGDKGVTPFLNQMAGESLLFTDIYATGFRTDIGLTGILTGFPSLAVRSILSYPEKAAQLPSLSSVLYKQGYATSFYYGGESEFFNIRSFVLNAQFKRLTDVRNFDSKDRNSKWGAHDGIVMDRMLMDLRKEQTPFFSAFLSLSNHEPFEIPAVPHFKGNDLPNRFRSTAYYTDSCLGAFFQKASKEPWYANTLFVLVADHGHRLPLEQSEIYEPARSRIPLLFAGPVLKQEFKGKRIGRTGSQADLPGTLLAQLQLNRSAFYWSKNLLSEVEKPFAFATFDNGFSYFEPGQKVSFDNNSRRVLYTEYTEKQVTRSLKAGQAILQKAYDRFLSY